MSVSTDEFEDAISDQNLSMNNDNDNDATPSIQKANSPASTLNAHPAESIHSVETEQTIDSNVSSNSKKNKKKKNKKKNKKKQQEEQEEPEQGDQDDQAEDPLDEEEQKREGDEDVLQNTTIQLDRDGEAEEVKNDANGEIESINPVSNEEEKLTVVVPKPIVNDEALENENPEEDIPEVIDPQVPDQNSPVVDLDQNSEDAVKKNENTEGIIDSESPLKTNEDRESPINEDRESPINQNHQGSTNENHESPINDHDKTLNGDSEIKEEPIEKEVLVVDSPSKPQSDDDTKVNEGDFDKAPDHQNIIPDSYSESSNSVQASPSRNLMSPAKSTTSNRGIPGSSSSSQLPPDSPAKISNNSPIQRIGSNYSKAYSPIDSPQRNAQTLQEPFIAKSIHSNNDHNENIDDEELVNEPPLPSRKSIKDCLRLDQPNAVINTSKTDEESLKRLSEVSASYQSNTSNFLLQSKFNEINRGFESKDIKSREQINSGSETIKKTFNDIKDTVGGVSNDFFDYDIDWEFWTRVVNDYESVIKNESDELHKTIMKGIPKEFRGIVWQVIAKSKNFQLEEFYLQLKNETSIHEKSIKRDLTRTSFFTNVDQIKKTDELFNVIKAYSLFDPDVGYTQGMIFIVVPLIMNMNESECFGLLVTLMKDYKLRSLFCPEMKGLHLLLYEFDRLLEIYSPRLYNHLVKQGIKSSMYASQWFLTFFAYKFPLDIVLRIFDIIITQGIEAILKFSINLMIKNESNLINLKFDKLLEFLKSNLFNLYVNEEFINFDKDGNIISTATAPPAGSSNTSKSSKRASTGLNRSGSVSKRFSLLGGNRGSIYGGSNTNKQQKGYYKLDELVYDAMQINVVPLDLNKFELEFENIYINETSKIEEIEELRIQNGKLRHDIKLLETEYANVNRDHIEIVQHMVDIKVELPEILNDNEDLHKQIDQLRLDIEELQSKMVSSPDSESSPSLNSSVLKSPAIPTKIENDIQELLVINAQETEKFANLEDELHNLMAEDEKLTNELKSKTAKKWFPWNKKA